MSAAAGTGLTGVPGAGRRWRRTRRRRPSLRSAPPGPPGPLYPPYPGACNRFQPHPPRSVPRFHYIIWALPSQPVLPRSCTGLHPPPPPSCPCSTHAAPAPAPASGPAPPAQYAAFGPDGASAAAGRDAAGEGRPAQQGARPLVNPPFPPPARPSVTLLQQPTVASPPELTPA
jgi:hypothetical protein